MKDTPGGSDRSRMIPARSLRPGSSVTSSSGLAEGRKRVITSEALLGAEGELVILHRRQEYRLRRTQQGKLILTK